MKGVEKSVGNQQAIKIPRGHFYTRSLTDEIP